MSPSLPRLKCDRERFTQFCSSGTGALADVLGDQALELLLRSNWVGECLEERNEDALSHPSATERSVLGRGRKNRCPFWKLDVVCADFHAVVALLRGIISVKNAFV
jgi:hypothetical protein